MRKQTKLVAVLSAAALLAMGASMTSFAKAGWALDGDEWVWLDGNGDRVTNEWKKSADGNYYWLDEDGLIAENAIIEDDDEIYYVNEYGIRVKNAWQSVINEDDLEVNGITPDELWYYFGANGRATRKSDTSDNKYNYKKISLEWSQGTDTFFFDTEGHMVTGWIEHDKDVYYCTEYGNAVTGWQELEPDDDMVNSHSDDYEDTERFNFKDSGKLRKADEGKGTVTWYSNGQYYAFDENGVLLTDWYDVSSINATYAGTKSMKATKDEAGYAGEYPAAGTGWVYSLDPEEDDYHWYYLVSINDGKTITRNVPFNLMANDSLYRAKQIKGKTYLFDDKGVMKDGLVDLRASSDKHVPTEVKDGKTVGKVDEAGGAKSKALDPGIYYFRKDGATTAGQMVTGKTAVTDDGETNYYYFDSKRGGAALINTVKDGIVYGKDGKRMDADDGNSNQIKTVEDDLYDYKTGKVLVPDGSEIIVTSAGKLRTNGTVKSEGDKFEVKQGTKASDGTVTSVWQVNAVD